MKKALVSILILLMLAAVKPSVSQSHWTVMIYMNGDCNLEPAAIDDMNELEFAGSSPDVNIVVEVDRSPFYDSSNGNWTTTRRYYITKDPNGYDSTIVSTLLSDLGEQNMGNPSTLVDFVNWARTTYPADYYLLVLWDHGDGWKTRFAQVTQKGTVTKVIKREPVKGVCYDDTDGDYLSTPDLGAAFNSMTASGTNPLDVTGFDACLMNMIEVNYEISPYTSYVVGSEESVPFDGWDYATTMDWLVQNPLSTPDQVASKIVTDYMGFYGLSGFETQSAVNSSTIPGLASAVNILAQDLTNNMSLYVYDIKDARILVEEYSDSDFIDLYHFAQLIQNEISNPLIQTDAQNVMNAVVSCVIQEGHGATNPGSHGLSIYFPYGGGDYLSRYETDTLFAVQTQWDEFLTAYYSTVPPPVHAVALIDDDNGRTYTNVESFYTDALTSLGIQYDYYDAELSGSPDLTYLQAHSVVIWFTGSDFATTLSPQDESNLMQYLDGGGKLFFSSQDYVWDLKLDGRYPSTFLRNYLHTAAEIEDTYVNILSGVAGNEVGDGLGPYEMCWYSTTCSLSDYADTITKDGVSEYAFTDENNDYVALTYSSGYDVVFFAFRYEGITSLEDRQEVMDRIFDFFEPIPTLGSLAELFSDYSFFVAGDTAYCTDVLGSAKISFVLSLGGALENPEGRTDLILTSIEHDTGNLMIVGGPAVNPVADEFDNLFSVTYNNNPPVSFEIFSDSESIYLDLSQHPHEDIAVIHLGEHNGRYVLIVWGYGWWGTYAASVFLADMTNWDLYRGAHMLMLRWVDANYDGLVQQTEIVVEVSS